MSTEQDKPETRKRTAAEIEADLLRTRAELTRTVDELTDRVDPRRQVRDLTDQAKNLAGSTADHAKSFAEDVKAGNPKAIGIVGAAATVVAAIVGISVLRRSR
ncbi:DUF3618 domain-containing protein [Occultella glacieicola]|uniref:DUF3618 domain-containing protein n=1 Tax=Occultella glacieicola TaxID=2518684 RepID=A0ABY2DXS4_9MICO|nr:DUF3618 domain-containing protein [Occultella glacieicola]TDE88851.1 DUF3618 domain-containing protein [Occultella glacieicola]